MRYDIADYMEIDHRYGTWEDVDELISELKKRDMRLMVVDLAVNYTGTCDFSKVGVIETMPGAIGKPGRN